MAFSKNGKSTIVVVGGGVGGLALLNSLSTIINPKKHTVVLIDARPVYIHLISSLRLVVSNTDDLITRSVHPYGDHTFQNKLVGNGKFIKASVTAVKFGDPGNCGQVILDNGEVVAYDILVLTTGSTLPHPIAFPTGSTKAVEEYVKTRQAEFAAATDILLVGGGPIGIELSGELRDVFPSTAITIIHRAPLLLNAVYPDKFRVAIQKQLEDRGITILTGDTITSSDSLDVLSNPVPKGEFITEQGKTLMPDLVIPTWGMRPNTAYLPSDLLSPTSHVKILPTFQLPTHPNVFVIGDIVDCDERKSASRAAFSHAPKVAKSVVLYLDLLEARRNASFPDAKLDITDLLASKQSAKYKKSIETMMVSNGKDSGMCYFDILWGIMVGGWLSSLLNSKDLMVSRLSPFTGYTPS
ncbi:hypothetical protein J3R30DRAFT_581487 [Lentinula aciculospora]|uniref:FAD/NAD(P)-binding domain-containing protein n=1 Tax=Lentinula aciculospora TaxID=153920 RepID=A0A9W9A6L2_9AGAR|nr:hypothetical protein J3R30DRAFT_581487 [Lentinula aciculospora]